MDSALLRRVADRQEISQQIYLYCRSMDRIDHEIGYALWHDGGTADYGTEIFQGTGRGYIDQCLVQHSNAISHTHQVTNIVIELHSDRAASESYFYSVLRLKLSGEHKQITTWGRYIDTWSRRNEGWRIDERVTIRDLDEISDYTAFTSCQIGSRDKTDPSYAVLESLR